MLLAGCLTSPSEGTVSCDAQFSVLSSYKLCSEDAHSCDFFVLYRQRTTCSELCAEVGADCLGSIDKEPPAGCDATVVADSCRESRTGQICRCTRGRDTRSDAAPNDDCDQAFGDAPGYQLCWREGDVCGFYAVTGPDTCETICQAAGAPCAGSNDAEAPDTCQPVTSGEACAAVHDDQMCWCQLPL